ncbi:HEAT-like repeat protein (modular protein) [Candidatus Desulfosporosinus infrequens]|uniref:HEAT-like repeat protein (Modular protein) n=1 Tax=Candidatus Desulfosporosinus infrequens TaxID=2043169 RepID=A0A2U3KQ68_9FIRM|nr:HEAT-like repeat protein (modular protein) [Candidatus Desulfosporosinus infrequens]
MTAIEALARTGHLSSMIILVDQLEKETSFYLRRHLIQALGSIQNWRTGLMAARLFISTEAHVRNAAVEVLQALQEYALPTIETLMTEPSRDIRKLAVDVLDKIPVEKAFSLLIQGLQDREAVIVSACAEALGRKKDPRGIVPLLELLQTSTNVWISFSVVEALSILGDPQVLESVYQHINHSKWEKQERIILFRIWAHSAGKLGDEHWLPKVWELLERGELSEDGIIELLAEFSQRGINWNDESPLLEGILLRQFEKLKGSELYPVAHIALQKSPQLFYQFLPQMMENVVDDEEIIRIFQQGMSKTKPTADQLKEFLLSSCDKLTIFALRLIEESGSSIPLETIVTLADRADPQITQKTVALAWRSGPEAEPFLYGMLKHHETEVIASALNGLGLLGSTVVTPLLLEGFSNPDELIRRQSVAIFCRRSSFDLEAEIESLLENCPQFALPEIIEVMAFFEHPNLERILPRLGDIEDEVIRARIAKSARLIRKEKLFVTVMKHLSNDPDQEVRHQVILSLATRTGLEVYRLLAYLYRYDQSPKSRYYILTCPEIYHYSTTMDWLQENINGSNPLLQWAAAKGLRQMGEPGSQYLQELYEVALEKDLQLAEIIHQELDKKGGLGHDTNA